MSGKSFRSVWLCWSFLPSAAGYLASGQELYSRMKLSLRLVKFMVCSLGITVLWSFPLLPRCISNDIKVQSDPSTNYSFSSHTQPSVIVLSFYTPQIKGYGNDFIVNPMVEQLEIEIPSNMTYSWTIWGLLDLFQVITAITTTERASTALAYLPTYLPTYLLSSAYLCV